MATNNYRLSKFLLKMIILTYCGHVLTRSIPSRNLRHHNVPSQFSYPLVESLPVQPIYYNPMPQAYQHHIEPTGTFYDRKRGILRSFPGGGIPLLVDYQKRCSNNYVGIKPHPNQNQYYYVCKPDCVVFGKCQNLQAFDASKGQCVPYPQPNYTPICKKPGRFPIFGDCTTYYRCDTRLRPQIFSCPRNTVFSPQHGKCICDAKCSPTIVSPYGTYIPQDCVHKFPPCMQDGTFRTPNDCSLYYICALQPNQIYLQTRFRCTELTFYDTTLGVCRPQHEVACDAIQLSELVFPRQPVQPRLPVVYPPHYSLDSLEDNQFSNENSMSSSKEESFSSSVSSNEDSHSTEVNNEVMSSSREKIYPRLTGNAQRTTELTIPFSTHTPTTISYPTTTPPATPTDYTTLHSFVGTENPMYTITHSTDNMVQYYPSTQITLPPTDQIKYIQFSHHERPNTIENTLDETDLRNIRSILRKTATDNEVYIQRKGHLNTESFKNILDSYKFDSSLPPITQSPIQYKWIDYDRHQTTEAPNKLIRPKIRTDIGLEATTSPPMNEQPEGVLHEMQSNETLDDVSYYEDDLELDEVLPAPQTPTPNAISPNVLSTQINKSEPSSNLDDPVINNVASQLPSPSEEPTTTNLVGDKFAATEPKILHALDEKIGPQERWPSAVEPTPTKLDMKTMDASKAQLGLSPPREAPPTNITREIKLDATKEDLEHEHALGDENSPQYGTFPSIDPTPTDHVREKLDAADADPETAAALGEEVVPQEGLPQTEGVLPHEGLSPSIDPTPPDLVREKLDAADTDPETAAGLGKEVVPQEGLPQTEGVLPHEGLSPSIDPTPPDLVREKLDAADTDPETAAGLGKEVVPQEGLPQTEGVLPQEGLPPSTDPTPSDLVREKLDAADAEPQTAAALPEGVVPQEGLPQTEGVLPHEGLPPSIDPTPTDHVREMLDAADADPETAAELREGVVPQEGLPRTEGVEPLDGLPPSIDPTPSDLVREKLDAADADPETAAALGEGVVSQEGLPQTEAVLPHEELPPSIDPTPTDHVREMLDAANAHPETAAELQEGVVPQEGLPQTEGVVPQEGLPPSIAPTPTDHVREKLDAADADPETAAALEEGVVPQEGLPQTEGVLPHEGLSPSIPPTPTDHVREKLDAADADPETAAALGEVVAPQEGLPQTEGAVAHEGLPPSIDPTPSDVVREKLDAVDADPETAAALGEGVVPQEGVPQTEGAVAHEGLPPSVDPRPSDLVRENLVAADADPETAAALGQGVVPQEGLPQTEAVLPHEELPPSIDPTPTDHVREMLDAANTNPETAAELQEGVVPQEGLPQPEGVEPIDGLPPSFDPTPSDLVRENLDAADADPETAAALGQGVVPQEGLPQTEGVLPQEGLPPSIDPTPTDLVREKLDAADADPETAAALGQGVVPQEGLPQTEGVLPQEGLPPSIDPTPTDLVREKLDAGDGEPETAAALGEGVVPQEGLPQTEGVLPHEGLSPSIDPMPTDLVREKLDAADADPETATALREGVLPQEGLPRTERVESLDRLPPSIDPTPSDLVREKFDAADADPETSAALGEGDVPQEGLPPSVDITPTDLVREKFDAAKEDSENAPPLVEAIPPFINPTLADDIMEQIDATDEATPTSPFTGQLGEEVIGQNERSSIPTALREDAQKPSESEKEEIDRGDEIFSPTESTPANFIRENLDSELPPVLVEDNVPPKGSFPPIEPTPFLVREKLDAEMPPVLGEENVPPKGSSPPIDPTPNLVREKLDAEMPPLLGEDNIPPKRSSPPTELTPSTKQSFDQSHTAAMDITMKPAITGSRNEGNIWAGVYENETGYNGADWNESQMNDPQTRVVKSVTASKERLNTLPNDEATDPKTKSKNQFDGHEELNHLADVEKHPSLGPITEPTTFGVSENVVQPRDVSFENTNEITTANEIDTIKVDSDTTTSKQAIQANTDPFTTFSDLGTIAEHQSSTTDMSSTILLQTNSVTTESLTKVTTIATNALKEISKERSDIPAPMENVIAVLAEQRGGQHERSTSPNMVSTNSLADKAQNSEHLTEPTDSERTQQSINAESPQQVSPFEDNDESDSTRSPAPQTSTGTTRAEEAMNNTTTESAELRNHGESIKENGKTSPPAMQEFVKEKEFGEVFNMESSSEAIRSSTNTINSEVSTNRDIVERHTSLEHKENVRGFQNEETKFVRGDEAKESKESHLKDVSNIIDKLNTSTKLPFDESFTTEFESTTEGSARDSSDWLRIKQENSVDDNSVIRGDSQIEEAHVRVVKAATGVPSTIQTSPIEDTPQTNQRSVKIEVNSETNTQGTTFRPSRNAEIGEGFEQVSEIFKKTDFRISPIVKHKKFSDSLNFSVSDSGEMNFATTGRGIITPEANTNIVNSQELQATMHTLTEPKGLSNIKNGFNNFEKKPTQPRESLDNKFGIPDKRKIPADVLERATGLIRIDDSSPNFIKPAQFRTAHLIDNADSLLLPMTNTFITTNPTTDLSNKDIPKPEQPPQTPTEPVLILNSTTTTSNLTTAQALSTGENTETGATYEPLMSVRLQENFVDSTSDNSRIVRYTKDANQYPEATKRVYRQNPVPNTNSQIVTEDTLDATDLPKMEVVVFGDLDLSVLFCGNDCNGTHEQKYGKNSFGEQHAVGVQWDPGNSNKTMSLVTA